MQERKAANPPLDQDAVPSPDGPERRGQRARAERQAAALRANLRRRKEQQRGRAEPEKADDSTR